MISFHVTEDDQRAWMEFAIEEQGRVGALRVAGGLLIVVVTAFLGMVLGQFAGLGVGVVVGGILALTLVPWLIRRSVRAQIDEAIASAPDGSVGPVTLELTSETLTWRTTVAESTWKRRAIRRVAVRGDHVFIMFGPSNGLVIPLASNRDERQRFVDALNSGGTLAPPTD